MYPRTSKTLSIDQASNQAGVSLWSADGVLLNTCVLASQSKKDPFSKRVTDQIVQLEAFLDTVLDPKEIITHVLFEGVRSRLVLVTVGAFMTCTRLNAGLSAQHSFVESRTWKAWAKRHGAKAFISDVKGVESLLETGFNMPVGMPLTEDIADSIMMYLAWKEKNDPPLSKTLSKM